MPSHWRDEALAKKWSDIRAIRAVVTGALEVERAEKRIGSSLEAAPARAYFRRQALRGARWRRFRRSLHHLRHPRGDRGEAPPEAFRLPEVKGVAVSFAPAPGVKCARSWRYFDPAAADPDYPDVTPRDAQALREIAGLAGRGERVEP